MIQRFTGTQRPMNEAGGVMRRSVVLFASLLLVCVLMAGAVSADNWQDHINATWYADNGDSNPTDGTYYIHDAASLAAFAKNVTTDSTDFSGKTVKLMADIDLNAYNWTAIGTKDKPFKGTFDGDNHTISNVNVYAPDSGCQGLFGYSATPAILKNIKIQNVKVVGGTQVGALAGSAYTGSSIENCHVSGTIQIQGNYKVAGLVGDSYVSSITKCSVTGDQNSYVKGFHKGDDLEGDIVGGLIGYRAEGKHTLSDCYADIAVSGTRKVGGLIGTLQGGNTVSNCSASGTVALIYVSGYGSGKTLSAGALVGDVHPKNNNQETKIEKSTAKGMISLPTGATPEGATVSIGLIGAVRSDSYNKPDDITTLTKTVKDTTYAISLTELQKLVDTDKMVTAGIGTFTFNGAAASSNVMIPGINMTGVTWTGDNDAYSLEIGTDASGTYLLMKDVNLKSMTVSVANVVIDGNGKTITAKSGGTNPIIQSTASGVTFKNLNVTGTGDFSQGTFIKLAGESNKLSSSVIDFKDAKTNAASSFHTIVLNGKNTVVSDSTILAGKSTSSSSQCIVVQGISTGVLSGIEITGNTLTPNTAAEYKSDNTKVSSGSIGVRIADNVESITITGNTITCTQTDTSMNNGIAIDGVNKAVTITANNNKFTLSAAAAKKEENKKGQVGGFGNAFYVNPASTIASNAITLNANGNKVTGGTYFLYADSDNGGTTSYTLSGTIQNNDFGTISGKKYEITPIATVPTVSGTLTWTNNVEPAIPDVPKVTPTTNVDGSTKVTPDNTDDTAITGNTATIGKTDATVHLEISGSGVARDDTSGAITAPADAVIKAVYKEAPAATASTTTAKFALSIVLKDVAVDKLPTISPAFDEDKASKIPSGYTAAVMITALNPTDINSHITLGGIQLTFSVPKTWVNSIGKSNLAAFHIDANGANPAEITGIDDASDPVKVTVKGDTFSTYALAAYTATPGPVPPGPQTAYSSGDGNMENAFRVLFETQGGSSVTPATGLSYGDRITAPANPVRDGYTFGGWYKDAACTQTWSFSDVIDGDMTLYAKWTGGSAAQQTTTATASATAQPTEKQTTAPVQTQSQGASSATTAAPAATTAAGGQPTLTQAPAPVFGALLGLLAAGVLLRRRD